jgi:hypothetical protein
MGKFKFGQVVDIKKVKDLGIIVEKAALHPHHWVVAMRKKELENTVICIIDEKEIQSYKDVCWYCHSEVNSENDDTCQTCGWVICPSCGSCRKNGCLSSGIEIFDSIYKLKYNRKPKPICIDLDLEFDEIEDIKFKVD